METEHRGLERERAARDICARLQAAGHQALWAGGCVRDCLLGRAPYDYDIATSARVEEIRRLFGSTVEIGAAFGVTGVVLPEGSFEVATFRSDGPYRDGRRPSQVAFSDAREDALRRDFTINALFLDPPTGAVLDFVGGQADLERGIIRAVGDPDRRFAEDYLRLLRAARFSARLGFALDPATEAAMTRHAPGLTRISAERIRDELSKMLTEGEAAAAFRILDRTGLLDRALPEVAAMKGVAQPEVFHPEGDVFEHTMACLAQLRGAPLSLALAALLHDVGKPVTQRFAERIRFDFHDMRGARIAERVLRRLRFPNNVVDTVVWLVEQHMRFAWTLEMRESKRKRFVRDPRFTSLVELARIDALASHGDVSNIERIEAFRNALGAEEMRPGRLLTGHGLAAMGYAPGPLFAEILRQLEDAQLEGWVRTEEEARRYVSAHWPLAPPTG